MTKFIFNKEKAKKITQELADRSDMKELRVKPMRLLGFIDFYVIKFQKNEN